MEKKALRAENDSGKPALELKTLREVKTIPIDDLRFDPENPRVSEFYVEKKPTQAQIEDWLVGSTMKARELIPSFMENGYIPYEPLIVRQEGSKYIVIEGNRRLAAIRSMQKSDDPEENIAFEKHGLSHVPCLIFTGEPKELLAYLGLRHLSKTKDWSTSAQGAFVERFLKSGFQLQEASRLTNTSPQALRLILLTRRMFGEALNLGFEIPQPSADTEMFFWYLGDVIRRTRTKKYLKLEENPDPLSPPSYDQSKFENLITWIFGSTKERRPRVISSIRDVRALDLCLGNERAIRALESGASLAEAEEELEAAGANISAHLERAKRSVQQAGASLSDVDKAGLSKVREIYKGLLEAIKQFEILLRYTERERKK
jgi:hypothetical protein